jgi:hypothetical protein
MRTFRVEYLGEIDWFPEFGVDTGLPDPCRMRDACAGKEETLIEKKLVAHTPS